MRVMNNEFNSFFGFDLSLVFFIMCQMTNNFFKILLYCKFLKYKVVDSILIL